MKTYELQVYQNGNWKFDSYFDQRDVVISEAERIDKSGKFMGVRVLEENFDEEKDKSSFTTVFSRLKKIDDGSQKAGKADAASTDDPVKPVRVSKAARRKKSRASTPWLMIGGFGLILLGIAAMLLLRSFVGIN